MKVAPKPEIRGMVPNRNCSARAIMSAPGCLAALRASRGRPLVLDGGLATELEARGFHLTTALWSGHLLVTNRDAVLGVHRAYLAAGCDILTTASYQVCVPPEVAALPLPHSLFWGAFFVVAGGSW